jgi:Ca2+-binding RTX toxin-like protein
MKDVCPSASGGVEAKAVTDAGYHWFHGQCRGDDVTEVCCRIADATSTDPRIVEFTMRGTDQADELRFSWSTLDLEHLDVNYPVTAVLLAEAGDDDVYGSRLDSYSDFREFLYGGTGRDFMKGLDGRDDITGGADGDFVDGGDDVDDIETNGSNDFVAGGGGGDNIDTHDGADYVCDGQVTSDPTRHSTGNYFIFTGCSSSGSSGNDVINTGEGNDRVWTFDGVDTINLGDGNDWADDTVANATMTGGNGDDVLCAGSASTATTSYLDGDAGTDLLLFYGTSPRWELDGGTPTAGSETDTCYPGTGDGSLSFVYDCDPSNVVLESCPAPSN